MRPLLSHQVVELLDRLSPLLFGQSRPPTIFFEFSASVVFELKCAHFVIFHAVKKPVIPDHFLSAAPNLKTRSFVVGAIPADLPLWKIALGYPIPDTAQKSPFRLLGQPWLPPVWRNTEIAAAHSNAPTPVPTKTIIARTAQ